MIYFDNSATTKPYPEALKTYMTVSESYFANPSSIHRLGGEVEKLISTARNQIAGLLRVNPGEVVFTSGGTEANNLAIKGIAIEHQTRGKHLISTEIEHASCYESFRQLEHLGFDITFLPVDRNGHVSIQDLRNAIRHDSILVSVMHVNNEIGTIQPVEEIGQFLKKHPKIFFHVDHVQGIGKVPLQYVQSGVDLCSFSSHKFHGPKGVGILYIRNGVTLSPLLHGGSQEFKHRAGTENIPGIIAMAKALRLTMEKSKKEMDGLLRLNRLLRSKLVEIEGVVLNTPEKQSAPHIINFSVPGIKPEVLIHSLEERDVFVSTKSACSSKSTEVSRVLEATGYELKRASSAIRISLSFDNTMNEGERFIAILEDILNNLTKVMRY
ncbi:cysteine desulfurase family protein [Pseudalkalibacillus salsuginis]|uniref:cysteine desulfurase family protein n=1 Tax=Pseudalkalibacillus salsuginis TaxID=2910972 RepID=UPI001F2C0796|nr:cysteine desulfurase family protein [Pseudalkalibacillus salsuginis]MCF6408782.1 cysteine desulfurase [Pseudalkalibacillus salsuginis]